MASRFRYEVESFLSENMIYYRIPDKYILIPDHKITLFLMEMDREILSSVESISVTESRYGDCLHTKNRYKQFAIYEDLWFTKGNIIRNRLLANFGLGARIFARRCRIEKINAVEAKEFLEVNHLIGDAKSLFRYGLFYKEELVSVATFSASRPMEREGRIVRSYEWVRYANKGSLRVVGGMGKLLDHFVVTERPEEIMSYADIDWSDGDVYRKLGFVQIGETPPVKFYVNSETYERIPAKKLLRDRKYRVEESKQNEIREDLSSKNLPENLPPGRYALILNSGNLKFLRSFSLF